MAVKRNLKPGLELIKQWEGLRLRSYKDSVGIWTIGYGTTRINGSPVKPGQTCTEAEALQWLHRDIETIRAPAIDKLVTAPLSDNAFGALLSFCYNLGVNALAKSTLLKRLNANEPRETVAAEFSKWNKADGQVLDGLTNRRAAEAKLFLQPDTPPAHGRPTEA